MRECGDIDLCFPSEKEEREAAELARRAGCRTERRPDGSVCYSWQGVEVEHHTRLFDLHNPLAAGLPLRAGRETRVHGHPHGRRGVTPRAGAPA
ncbi:nucleotidyltransferase family protein [Phocaeicola vulgatus]|nr:nucleotidyltransferase family protein [Phocaeicola vulgatus]